MAKMSKKPTAVTTSASSEDDVGRAVYGLAKEVAGAADGIADKLEPLYHIGDLALALYRLANATAFSVIARYGSDEDRATVVKEMKEWFEEFRD
jgi:hypothetical protein